MDKAEHALLRERMRALAREGLYVWLADMLRLRIQLSPTDERPRTLEALKAKIQAARDDYSDMTLPGEAPEWSDLKTAEFQEAFDELAKELLESLSGGKPLRLSTK